MTPNNKQLKDAGLKITSPRIKILQYLQMPECQHISAEELYKKLLDQGDEIGLATVYRVLNQFDDAGIVTRHHFEGGKSVFELAHQEHHDHLVCLDCGRVIEFHDASVVAPGTPGTKVSSRIPAAWGNSAQRARTSSPGRTRKAFTYGRW